MIGPWSVCHVRWRDLHVQVSMCPFSEHGDDVRAIVQRAVKDLAIEKSLKTYEEVWLSKVFEMREHVLRKPHNLDVTAVSVK